MEYIFEEMIKLAKKDNAYLLSIINKYDPLIIKYSIINGIFYEDLYSQLVEATIICIKKFNIVDS